jgi:hypothetical protein
MLCTGPLRRAYAWPILWGPRVTSLMGLALLVFAMTATSPAPIRVTALGLGPITIVAGSSSGSSSASRVSACRDAKRRRATLAPLRSEERSGSDRSVAERWRDSAERGLRHATVGQGLRGAG